MEIGLLIKRRLEELQMEQGDLAAAAQVTESYISQLLTRKKLPPAPARTDIYEKIGSFLKLPAGELAKLAEHQRIAELKKNIAPPAPLFKDVRELILQKSRPVKQKQIRAIFEKEPFGELERLVTQKLLDIVRRVAKEELEAFNPRATKAIEIEDFVDLAQIDPIYYDHTYYLVPDRGADKPYALLVEAMKRAGKVGIARFVLRTKQYLAAVRPMKHALAISTMLYADEVVSEEDLEALPDARTKPGERELKMAEQLIGTLSADFDVKKYKDDYREQVLALLERKAEGEEIVAQEPAEEPRGKVVNLMEALQKSLAAAKSGDLRERGEVRRAPEPEHRAAAKTARAPHKASRGGRKRKSG